MTPDEWLDIAALWARVWPNRPLPPESIEPWYDLLADLDGRTVRAALGAWAADPDRSWPPQSPGELRAATLPPEPDWSVAIGVLATAVRRHGRYSPRPALEDPALDAYVDSVGGWTRLCDSFDPADPTIRAQFRDHYQAVRRRERRDAAAAIGGAILPALTDGGEHDG
jgi:hypothetical protein